jgi:hypothetical protein
LSHGRDNEKKPDRFNDINSNRYIHISSIYNDNDMAFLKKKAEVISKKENIFTPTQNRIFTMSTDLLIKHYALIRVRQSSMGAEERRLVNNRIQFKVDKGTITIAELQAEVDKVEDMIEQTLKDASSNHPF